MSEHEAIIAIMPATPGEDALWLHVVEGRIVLRCPQNPLPSDAETSCRSMLVLPVTATTIHRYNLPDLSVEQGRGVARRMAMEASLGADEPLHAVAKGHHVDPAQHIVATITPSVMAHALDWAGAQGFDPDFVVPAGLILPEPETGFVRAKIGSEIVARGQGMCLPGSGALAEAIIGTAPCVALSTEALDTALIAAIEDPPLNLRAGPFARRALRKTEPTALVRIAIWGGFIALASLLISLVLIARYHLDTRRLDTETIALARPLLPAADDALLVEQDLKVRLAAAGSGEQTFSAGMAALVHAMRPVPSVSLILASRGADGAIHATLAAARAQDIATVIGAVQAAGFNVTSASTIDPGGRSVATITVTS